MAISKQDPRPLVTRLKVSASISLTVFSRMTLLSYLIDIKIIVLNLLYVKNVTSPKLARR